MSKGPSVHDLSQSILDHLRKTYACEDFASVENIRLALGLTLSSIHATILIAAKTDEQKTAAVKTVFDTFQRMGNSLARDLELAGVEGIEFYTGPCDFDFETPNGEVH